MPEYLAPGVFVEETSFRAKSIEGVSTSVAALVGPLRFGPLRGTPEVVTSFGEFRRVFGDDRALRFGTVDTPNYSAHAVRAFFDNGGKQLFVVRTARAVNEFPGDNADLPVAAGFTTPLNRARFEARFPGAYGSFHLEVRWRDREPLLLTEAVASPEDNTLVLAQIGEVAPAALVNPPAGLPAGAISVIGIARHRAAAGARRLEVDLAQAQVIEVATRQVVAGLAGTLTINLTPAVLATLLMTRASVRRPAGVAPNTRFPVVFDLRGSRPGDLSPLLAAALDPVRRPRLLLGDSDGATVTFRAATTNVVDAVNPPAGARPEGTLAADLTVPAALLAAPPFDAAVLTALPRRFDVDVRTGSANGEVVYTYADVELDPAASRRLDVALPRTPARSGDAREMPLFATLALAGVAEPAAALLQSLWLSFDATLAAAREPRFVFALTGGSDGAAPVSTDYAGETDEQIGSTGLTALEDVEDVSIVMTPAAAADANQHQAITNELLTHLRKMRYRVGVVDSQAGMSFNDIRTFRNQFSDDRLALYYPWVTVSDPNRAGAELLLPPSGFVAGTYARTDVIRGVHKAPANEVVFGALRFEIAINKFQQELLNPEGINCLRSFPRLGHRIWGGRTLGADPEWKYVNVRRYFLYLERSIDKSTQWVVFEPNGERLWANVRDTVEAFLFNEWKEGHLLGGSPKEAYFVKCDRTTMTQNDLDNGRLICLVGVAPLRPAEFVIFRVGQKTADA